MIATAFFIFILVAFLIDRYEQRPYAFVVRDLFRITLPGRMTAVHCMDVPSGNSGTDYLRDFPGDIIRYYRQAQKNIADILKHGWGNGAHSEGFDFSEDVANALGNPLTTDRLVVEGK